ncbi:MAG: flavodoxin family protein [Syntrophobacterales bacterium]|nr:flavodoxin family protein [Syntrophobacterales bacterium]HQM90308.1 flavodoxin family protein [Syntrophales bacterium]HQM90311.1 flavodoxin family protein [Syntrophales bacterium]
MAKKIIAITGSYRKGGIVERTVDAVLQAAAEQGAETETIRLMDHPLEFCLNCRKCTQEAGPNRRACVHDDEMADILDRIEAADGVVLASPVNFFGVTAVMQRFIERLVCYAYWPWGKPGPALRVKDRGLKAVLVTSSAMPAAMGRMFTRSIASLKRAAQTLGAKTLGTLFVGTAALHERQELPQAILDKARKLGHELAS